MQKFILIVLLALALALGYQAFFGGEKSKEYAEQSQNCGCELIMDENAECNDSAE